MADPAAGPTLRTPQDLMDLLAMLERAHPVDEWVVGDLCVWPIARTRLAHRLARRRDGRPTRPRLGSAGDLLRRAGRSGAAMLTALGAHRPPAGDGGPHVVVCGDGISFTAGPHPSDRHAEPFRRALADLGVATTLLEPGHRVPRAMTPPVVRIQPALDRRAARARLRRRPPASLPGHEAMALELAERGLGGALDAEGTLTLAAAAVTEMAGAFEPWLTRQQATAGAVVEYYALQGFAFVEACRRAGIPVIDLQHGVQGPCHFAYAGWARVPAGGFDLLPDRFWVWSEDEAHAIAGWAPEGPGRCLVGGNLELASWRATARGGDPAPAVDAAERLASGDGPFVLVALADEEPDHEVDALLTVLADAPAHWRWGLRCHPTDPDVGRWEQALVARGLTGVDVRASTELPLFALLDRTDVLVTRCSTVTLDAAAVGVPAVLTDPSGAALFAAEVDAGRATLAAGAAVVPAVEAALAAGRRPSLATVSPEPALRAVAELAGCAP